MGHFISTGGPFMIIVIALGVATLGANVVELARRDGRLLALVGALIAATFFCGVFGTTMGLYHAGLAIDAAGADQAAARLSAVALGIAGSTTAVAALFGMANAILAGIAVTLRRRLLA